MIHRSRRLATLPARRGMRARWLRCRIPDELEEATPTVGSAPGATPAAPGATTPAPDGPGSPGSAHDASDSPALVRPAFGHPTF